MTSEEFIAEWQNSRDYVEAVTSGSTGAPKTIRLKKCDMELSAQATIGFFGLGPGARYVCPMDFRYVGAKMMAVRSILGEGELVAVPPSNRFEWSGTADLLAIVPSQIECLLDTPDVGRRVRNLIIGGAAVAPDLGRRLVDAGVNAFSTYGMTESASHVAFAPIGSTIYSALPGITFACDERGCLIIEMPDRSVRRLVTNDRVNLYSATTFEWVGRYDNVINSGGLKISPEQVEMTLGTILSDMDFPFSAVAITSRKSDKWGEEIIALIETDAELTHTVVKDAKERYANTVGNTFAFPKQLITTCSIPKTSNGKICRQRLNCLFSEK